jgi:hypothetical protein
MLILCVSSCIDISLLAHTSCASNPAVLPATNFLDTVSLSIEYHSSSWIRAASSMFPPDVDNATIAKSLPEDGAQMSPLQSGRQLQDQILTRRTSLRDPHGEGRSKRQKFRHTQIRRHERRRRSIDREYPDSTREATWLIHILVRSSFIIDRQ